MTNAIKKKSVAPALLLGTLGISAAAALGWITYSRLFINHKHPLPLALNAERRTFANRAAGVLSYYRSRDRKSVV